MRSHRVPPVLQVVPYEMIGLQFVVIYLPEAFLLSSINDLDVFRNDESYGERLSQDNDELAK